MKNKKALIGYVIAGIVAVAVIVLLINFGSKSDDETTTFNPKNVSAENATNVGDGNNVVENNTKTISPLKTYTDKKGNAVTEYKDTKGNTVIRTIEKDGTVREVVKNKKGKVIKEKTYKQKAPETTKKANNKKKDDKKNDGKEHGVVANDGDGWSDFY